MIRGFEPPDSTLDSITRQVNALSLGYAQTEPRRTGVALDYAERSMTNLLGKGARRAQLGDVKAVYAKLTTISASVADDTGDYLSAVSTGEMAASLATEVGDAQTAGYAWSVVSGAFHHAGRHAKAVDVAKRARTAAGAAPAGAMALLEQATAAAALGNTEGTINAVLAAEAHHSRLSDAAWGSPGFGLLGTYHPANLKAFAGASLVEAGLYAEAAPRLQEAADSLRGSSAAGLRAFVWVHQARAELGKGDVGAAHGLAAMAVAMADTRPTAFIASSVISLDIASGGAFSDLSSQVTGWGFSPGSGHSA